MEVYEITGYQTGVSEAGVNYLQPGDSFQRIVNGYIYRQVLQSRHGAGFFAPRLAGKDRILGIFEYTLPTGGTDLLVADRNFLYKFNTTTKVFDQLPFGGSMAAYLGFGIGANDEYISGTSYSTATNSQRFIFTGVGITPNANSSTIFFYDGISIKDFTNVGDNPNYSPPIDPITQAAGTLDRAEFVIYFGERLNFLIPTISGTPYEQGMLYSGIRSGTGNGDKFNASGSGLLQADTYEVITGLSQLGQILILNFNRSNWAIEKTRDAFNPYFIRKVPSVIGTNAKFSAQQWDDNVRSIGKTGIISTDGRESLRVDNKIPYFTANEIDQTNFNLTYGGFDRTTNQFLWSYKISESDSDTQNSVLSSNYEENSWSTYDWRFSVFGQTDIGNNLTWDQIDQTAGNSSWKRWDKTEELWDGVGLTAAVQKTLAGDNLGFVYELNQDFDDYFTDISNITKAANAVLTVDASAFKAGDLVSIESVEGMTQINNFYPDDEELNIGFVPWLVLDATPTSVTLDVDSTLFSSYTLNTGTISKIISFEAETIPFNPFRSQGRRCYVSHVEFLIDTNGGSLRVDVYDDEHETPFKQDILCMPKSSTKAREWINMTVDQESNFITFVLKQQSPSVQLRLTSMRIHCEPGGLTSG